MIKSFNTTALWLSLKCLSDCPVSVNVWVSYVSKLNIMHIVNFHYFYYMFDREENKKRCQNKIKQYVQ